MRSFSMFYYRVAIFVIAVSILSGVFFLRAASTAEGDGGDSSIKEDENKGGVSSLEQEMERLNSLIALDNNNADYFYNRGWIYEHMEETDKALTDYSRAIEINKKYLDALYNRGAIYLKTKRYELAVKDFSDVLRVTPSPDAYCNRGNGYLAEGRTQEAIKDFNAAIKMSPQDPDLYYNRAVAYLTMGKKTKAMDDMKEAARLGHDPARQYLETSDDKL